MAITLNRGCKALQGVCCIKASSPLAYSLILEATLDQIWTNKKLKLRLDYIPILKLSEENLKRVRAKISSCYYFTVIRL